MIKVHVEKVRGCSFKGYVDTSDLTEEQKLILGLEDEESVDVEGDFSVGGSSDDVQILEISCYAINDLNDLELDDDNADIDGLVEQIRDEADGAYLDHCIAMTDFADMD